MLTMRSGAATNILIEVKQKTRRSLDALERQYGEFDIHIADQLGQLSLYCIMGGEYDEALPLLHRKLVIHEKFGPDESIGDTYQQLGTTYRLYANYLLAAQHFEKARSHRERLHGKNSAKVAETLSSLAVLHHCQGNTAVAEDFHTQSLVAFYESTEEEDVESEEIPWEVFKRLRQQQTHPPSTAQNSMTLLKGTIRKTIQAAVLQDTAAPPVSSTSIASADEFEPPKLRMRSLSDGALPLHTPPTSSNGVSDRPKVAQLLKKQLSTSSDSTIVPDSPMETSQGHFPEATHEPITSFPVLVERVDMVKRKHASGLGFPGIEKEMNRLACDIGLIAAGDLRQVGLLMLGLLQDAVKLSSQLDQKKLPVLEGYLEKKSSSIFRGWERRWFKVDTRTLVLTYFHSKEDQMRGFAPRGSFALSRITHLVTHAHLRGNRYAFDIVVDLGTRANPHATRTFELRCESEADLKYWVDTIEKYQAFSRRTSSNAAALPPSPQTSPPTSQN
ncbi:hypothetical protein SPRG_08326 [Saprolegnia parasitica CBS 223.65]|uniref:PH domain-containing protein n=1 Tax=Saprolegnia parasitica (strain CBS 223.65) TaxID=695850 RepID=A0A067CI97_SAPPC|nr:hypothetical protein SPRG_08326 [Saprolegnia parasitica CBS 223.65]KDO26251.1 hypothetical protein SPRG_08326 [Saprolegnia parasitica CBS 223.65]|eukprot:XP_012202960.1 hypothetical protein SPRG_08326 [Saprolegnia parasitica CBS 223.65]